MNVLFVQSGIPFYYPSIETSIYNSLIRNGQTVTIISIERAIKTAFKIRPDFILVLHSLHVDLKDYSQVKAFWI